MVVIDVNRSTVHEHTCEQEAKLSLG